MATEVAASPPLASQRPHIRLEGRSYSIPNEVIIHIAQHIQQSASLRALILCSHHLRNLTEPILYTQFNETDAESLHTFIRTLLARPDLARRVTLFRSTAYHGSQVVSSFDEEDWTRASAAVRVAHIRYTQADETSWFRRIKAGLWEELVALFLCLAPNLQDIAFSKWNLYAGKYERRPAAALEEVLCRGTNLQNHSHKLNEFISLSSLKTVSLDFADEEDIFFGNKASGNFERVVQFLELRSVTKLEACGIIHKQRPAKFAAPLRDSFWTRELILKESDVSHTEMEPLFRGFKSLERLYYRQGPPKLGLVAFEPPRVMTALEHLKHSLKDLTIIILYPGDYVGKFEDYPIGSFVSFPKLTSIDTMSDILIGKCPDNSEIERNYSTGEESFPRHRRLVDILPTTLQHLSLRYVQPHHVLYISELISTKADRVPHLETINLQWERVTYCKKSNIKTTTIHPGFSDPQASELMALCEVAGVKIIMTDHPPRPKYVSYPRILTPKEISEGLDALWGPIITETEIFDYPYEGMEEFCQLVRDDEGSIRPRDVNRKFVVTDANVFQYPYEGFPEFCREYGYKGFGGRYRPAGYNLAQIGFWRSNLG